MKQYQKSKIQMQKVAVANAFPSDEASRAFIESMRNEDVENPDGTKTYHTGYGKIKIESRKLITIIDIICTEFPNNYNPNYANEIERLVLSGEVTEADAVNTYRVLD